MIKGIFPKEAIRIPAPTCSGVVHMCGGDGDGQNVLGIWNSRGKPRLVSS